MLFDSVIPPPTLGTDRLLLFISLISFQNALSFLHRSFLASDSFLSASSFLLINLIAPLTLAFALFLISNSKPCLGLPSFFFQIAYVSRDISYSSDANSFQPGRLRFLPFDRFLVLCLQRLFQTLYHHNICSRLLYAPFVRVFWKILKHLIVMYYLINS